MSTEVEIRPDDWVRFYRDAHLVIGEVRYVHSPAAKDGYRGYQVDTDQGSVNSRNVIEIRRGAELIRDFGSKQK